MPNTLILDKTDQDIADALKDCKVGDTKTLEVTVEVTRDDDKVFTGDVTEVTYAANEAETNTESAGEETMAAPKGKMSYSGGAGQSEY